LTSRVKYYVKAVQSTLADEGEIPTDVANYCLQWVVDEVVPAGQQYAPMTNKLAERKEAARWVSESEDEIKDG
jgi:hypothetical protein